MDENQTGSYIRRFAIPSELTDCQLRLRFEGVDSAFHCWLNGTEIGYFQGARNPSEFDVTDTIVRDKENTLCVKVYQYCDGSYIEDQGAHEFPRRHASKSLTNIQISGVSLASFGMSTFWRSQKAIFKIFTS